MYYKKNSPKPLTEGIKKEAREIKEIFAKVAKSQRIFLISSNFHKMIGITVDGL